ncbi:MAG: trypsin-like peptidase domain-containing protein [Planctomycetes bacterium]|nr:trypsin-like peptidase domain-containing protein [Planctomycetota bacterium]
MNRRPGPGPIIMTIIGVGALAWLVAGQGSGQSPPTVPPTPRVVTPRGDLAADEQSTIELFERAAPSVVFVSPMELRSDFFGLNVFEVPAGTGSGFVWDRDGHIVTNYHVIQRASGYRVTLSDGKTYDARLVGAYPEKDLAVLHIDVPADELVPVALGDSSDLRVGQKVFAIGNPFGLDHSLTTGVVSALDRSIDTFGGRRIDGVIQTDAAINPGNSGGPLLDSAGRLIGINTAIYSPSGAFAGIGFAVPVDTVNRIVPQLIRYGRVERPGLGIEPFEDGIVDRLRLRGDLSHKGVLVYHVQPDSAAEKAGILPTRIGPQREILLGDLIVAIDGKPITNNNDLFKSLDSHKVGDTISISVIRDGDEQELSLTLQSLPPQTTP